MPAFPSELFFFSHAILEEASLALSGVQNHTMVKNLASEVRQPLDQILVPSGNTQMNF